MLSDQAKEMAESALKTVKELGKESGSEQSGFIKGISDFIKAGSEYTSGEIITDGRGDHVFLYTDTNRIFSTPK